MAYTNIVRLVDADAGLQRTLERQTVAQVLAAYRNLDWYDHAQIGSVAAVVGARVRAASQTSAALTAAYLTRVLREMLGATVAAAGTMRVDAPLRLGVPAWESVYGRVADTVRFEVARGHTLADAIQIGLDRADAMVSTDLALARREQARHSLTGQKKVQAYRRVIHPELATTGTCGLCIAAADRRYNTGELLPIHDRCNCTVLPITADGDPGGELNRAELDDLYGQVAGVAGSTSRRDLAEVRVKYDWHGELGPTLTDARHRSADPGMVRRAREARAAALAAR